nr:hypothetical protein [Candidatus Sigynarchaeota archaeon]
MKLPCEICARLGERLTVDHMEGEHVPEEFHRLVVVPDTDNEMFRCPACGQAYAYDHRFDNDVYNLYDVSEIRRVGEDALKARIDAHDQMVAWKKQQVKRYWRKARKHFGARMEELSAEEYRLMEYLKEKTVHGEYVHDIAADLSVGMDALSCMVDRMEKAGFIAREIVYPLAPGAHNFQEEVRDVDVMEYTKVRINIT